MDCTSLNHNHPSRSFSSTILRGCIQCRYLKVNSFICYPLYKVVAQTSFSIAAHTAHLNIVLSLDICCKLLNSIGEFQFDGQGIHKVHPGKIVEEVQYPVMVVVCRGDLDQVQMYIHQQLCSTICWMM